jgi:hypothetical protein
LGRRGLPVLGTIRGPFDLWERIPSSGWHAPCFRERRRFFQMYSILYIIGAIVVIIVVLRLLGLA